MSRSRFPKSALIFIFTISFCLLSIESVIMTVNIRKIISGDNSIYDLNDKVILYQDKDPVSVEAGQQIYYNSVINPAVLYVVAEHNGVIGIFNGTHTKLIELLNVDVCMLPEIDRQYLADGIKIYTSSELLSVICDYTG